MRGAASAIFVCAAAAVALLLGSAHADEPAPSAPPASPRVAIDACHQAVERELKNPKAEQIAYEGDSIYRAAIEIIVNGSLRLSSGKGSAQNYDYTCRYNERSTQTYGVKLEKRK